MFPAVSRSGQSGNHRPPSCAKSGPLPVEKKILCKFTRISRSAPAIQPENEVDKNAPAMEELNDTISQMLQKTGLSGIYTEWGTKAVILLGILLVTYAATKIFRHLVIPALQTISSQTKATWDDHLFNDRVLHGVCRLLPPVVWYMLLPLAFPDMPELLDILRKICMIYLVVVSLLFISLLLNTLYEISSHHETWRDRPLKGIYQMIKLVAVCIGAILILSTLIGKDATSILAGLGASAAVLMLIFRDSILGLVAGVQLSANDMLRPGDWITMSKYGADGYVTEVTLTTVKVQNFDKTITTIPPYALVSDSFQNWRGMWESGGRRIRRSFLIDANTVHFCSGEELHRFRQKGLMPEEEGEAPERERVNLEVFRNHLLRYIQHHPGIHPDLLQMVRMLQPTAEGIPVEIYCFTRTTEWIPFEALQGEISDHVIAVLPEFGLRIFQRPSGEDLQRTKQA